MMKQEEKKKSNLNYWDALVFFIQFLGIRFVMLEHHIVLPKRDSGAFLYIGQQILQGKMPYVDLWDHKGPLLFYLNALGLKLGDGKFNGVINLQLFLTVVATFVIYLIVARVYGRWSAIVASFSIIILLIQTSVSGNQVGQWALVFQALSIFLFCSIEYDKKRIFLKAFFIGVLGASVFLLRQNQIALWLGMGFICLLDGIVKRNNWNYVIKVLGGILSGVLITLGLVFTYFKMNGAFEAYWDASFLYNFSYSSATWSARMKTVFYGFSLLPLASFSLGAIALVFLGYKFNKEKDIKYKLALLASVTLIIEIIFTSVSGRIAAHYYANWLVAISLLLAFLVFFVVSILIEKKYVNPLKIALSITLIFSCSGFTHKYYNKIQKLKAHEGKWYRESVVEYVHKVTTSKDYVLHWGTVGSLNFLTKRRSPSKYFYQYAFHTSGYTSDKIINSFMEDLNNNVPKLIIDHTDDEQMPPLDKALRLKWIKSHEDKNTFPKNMEKFYSFVEQNYTYTGHIGKIRFYVYSK